MASPSSSRSSGAPAEPPPITRAWHITPDAAFVGPKKKVPDAPLGESHLAARSAREQGRPRDAPHARRRAGAARARLEARRVHCAHRARARVRSVGDR